MSEETMMIRCYVVDSSETIKVTLFPNDEIDDLRRQIKDREAATFRNVDESSIKVWKVRLLYKLDCASVLTPVLWKVGTPALRTPLTTDGF